MDALRFVFTTVKKFKHYLLLIFVIYLGSMAFSLMMPRVQGRLIDALSQGNIEGLRHETMWVVGVLIFSILFTFAGETVAWRYTTRVKDSLMRKVAANFFNKEMRFYNKYETGYVLSRLYEVFRLEPLFGTTIISIAMTLFSFVGALILIFSIDPTLGGMCLLLAPAYLLASYLFTGVIKRLEDYAQERVNRMTSAFISLYNAVFTLRMFNASHYFNERFGGRSHSYFEADYQTNFKRTQFNIIATMAGRIAPVVVLVYGGSKVIQGSLSVGGLFEFLGYLPFLYRPFERFSSFYSSFLAARVSLDRLWGMMNEFPEKEVDRAQVCPPLKQIEFRGVGFGYTPENQLIHNLNFNLKPGDVAALIAPSGSGKTTVLNLLVESLTPDSGKILFNGKNYLSLAKEEKRKRILFLSARPDLFQGSLRDNITLGEDFSDERIEGVLRAVNLFDRVRGLEQGIDTQFDEQNDLNFSEGEKQRFALARVLLRDGDVLIFDETTNNLDGANEKTILEAIRAAYADKMVLIVSHNLKDYFGVNKEIHLVENSVAA